MRFILIPCSGRKRQGGTKSYDTANGLASCLSDSLQQKIFDSRSELAEMLGLEPGPDLGKPDSHKIEYRPAYERYDGNLYRKADLNRQDVDETGNSRILIISALYGVALAREPIRNYNLSMSDRLINGTIVSTWWKRRKLGEVMTEVFRYLGATEIHDLLSTKYRSALMPWLACQDHVSYVPYGYSGLGTGSDYHRGSDLQKILRKN
jgi:Peroxide stress protein YaaA